MIILVTYDLNNPTKNYEPFFNALKAQGQWWHNLKSTWLIDTQKTPDQIWNAIAPHMETTDRVLITNLAQGHRGWLGKDDWAWINARKPPSEASRVGQSP